jgi:two-component system repressor protein LuxO
MQDRVLIVEDAASIGMVYEAWFTKAGIASNLVSTGVAAIEAIRSGDFRVVLLDLQLPDISGQEILDTIQAEDLSVTVVVVTGSGSLKVAVDIMRRGAYDFIVKPASEERLVTTTRNALERETLQKTVKQIQSAAPKRGSHGFIGSSLPMIAVYKTIDAVAKSNASVFISGESGTGKEVCAQAVHNASPRRAGSFVALNCAAIPKDLIESEIFGHLKGAFTGANSNRDGAATAANGGTLFLDEICEMDLSLQSKLLRFVQTGTVQKVGSDKVQKVDVRIVCATNRDPLEEVEEGRFREDLYYRLHVVPIELPPLKERGADVMEIASVFLEQMSQDEEKEFKGFSEEAENILLTHNWPGNVRELQNVVRNAVILNEGDLIDEGMLRIAGKRSKNSTPIVAAMKSREGDERLVIDLAQPLAKIERLIIETAIDRRNGSIPKAADMLSVSPSTIYRKKENWD